MFRNQHHLGEREDVNTQMNVLSFSQQVNIFFCSLNYFILYTYIRTLSADYISTTLLLNTLSSCHIIKMALSFPVEVVLQYVHCLGKRVTNASLTKACHQFCV